MDAQFTWTATATSPSIGGFQNQPTLTTFLRDTLTNTGTQIDSVIYHITATMGTCSAPDTEYVVRVLPIPDLVTSPLVKSICDSTNTNIDLEATNDSTKFTWTCTASSGNLSGYSNNTATPDTLINQVIDNTGFAVDTVYYHIVPLLFGCPGDTMVFKVAVYPTPDLSNSPLTKTICDNTGTNITLTSNVANAQFTWNCTASSPNVTGYANNAVPTTLLNQVLDLTGSVIEHVTYHITPPYCRLHRPCHRFHRLCESHTCTDKFTFIAKPMQ